jgi:protein phosphatase
LIRHELLTPEDAPNYPRKAILSRALGIESTVKVDIIDDIPVFDGERFVLCTDGLAKASTSEIKDIVQSQSPQQACHSLVELIFQKGGGDNITVLVVSTKPEY